MRKQPSILHNPSEEKLSAESPKKNFHLRKASSELNLRHPTTHTSRGWRMGVRYMIQTRKKTMPVDTAMTRLPTVDSKDRTKPNARLLRSAHMGREPKVG